MTTATSIALLATSFLIPLVTGANNWADACRGSCGYESGDGVNSAWSSLVLDGTNEAISDLSLASGWAVLECDTDSTDGQRIRIVCTNPDAGCDQLFEGGAENTIVRLPADCANAPFARVASTWEAEDQSLPSEIARLITKRDVQPQVMSLEFDFDFAAIPASRGTVSMTLTATTNPAQRSISEVEGLKRSLLARSARVNSDLVKRDLFASFVNANKASSSDDANRFHIGEFDEGFEHTFELLNVDQTFNVLDTAISCPAIGPVPAFDAALKVDVHADVEATVTVGFIIQGTIIPPEITKAAFTAALDGHAKAEFFVDADARGTFDTGLIPIFKQSIAGLDIPGIISVGPSFSINAKANGDLGVVADARLIASYDFPRLELVYPQEEGASSANAHETAAENPLQLAIGGSAALTGRVEAHLIPRVEIGVSVLSGLAKAAAYIQLDGYGTLDMSLSATGAANADINIPISSNSRPITKKDLPMLAAILARDVAARDSADGQYEGCVGVDAGVAIVAGAEGKLVAAWNDSVQWELYSQKWDVFDKCFGSNQKRARREHVAPRQLEEALLGLLCPSDGENRITSPII